MASLVIEIVEVGLFYYLLLEGGGVGLHVGNYLGQPGSVLLLGLWFELLNSIDIAVEGSESGVKVLLPNIWKLE